MSASCSGEGGLTTCQDRDRVSGLGAQGGAEGVKAPGPGRQCKRRTSGSLRDGAEVRLLQGWVQTDEEPVRRASGEPQKAAQ